MEVCRNILEVFELSKAMGSEVVDLHRFSPAHFVFVGVAIDAALNAILGDLVVVTLPKIGVSVELSVRRPRIRCPTNKLPKELRI